MTEVTQENYYSPEMQMAYMGSTQYKAFQKCEAAALAELRGEYHSPVTSALLIGGYVDAFFSGEWYAYMERHPEMVRRDGSLKADFQRNGLLRACRKAYGIKRRIMNAIPEEILCSLRSLKHNMERFGK